MMDQSHSATVRSLSTSLPDHRLTLRDSAMRGALDAARGESADTDPGSAKSTEVMKSVG
jgi:hypothetical protein